MVPLAQLLSASEAEPLHGAPMVYTVGETMSSIVVSRTPTRLEKCGRIAATWETRTSIAYLKLILRELGAEAEIRRVPAYTAARLLAAAPCALVLGDQALRARAQGLHVVADIGGLLWSLFQTPAVYAATATKKGRKPPRLRGPPWPKPGRSDVEETARTTGLPRSEAKRYHDRIRLDYNHAALLKAAHLLHKAAGIETERRGYLKRISM
jgi:predicted solute-binding protein